MSTVEFRIPMLQVSKALPGATPDSQRDWNNLTARANALPLPPTMQRAHDDAQYLTHVESQNVERIVREGAHRMYPGEQKLVPFMRAITHPVNGDNLRTLPQGPVPVVAPPVRRQPESVPTASIYESDLKALAKRLAETRPGNEDGNTKDVTLADLSADPSSLTGEEQRLCQRLRDAYFPVTYVPAKATVAFEVPFFANAQGTVKAVLVRKNAMVLVNASPMYLQDRVTCSHVEVVVPKGAKLVLNYDGQTTVVSQPESTSVAGDLYKIGVSADKALVFKVVAALPGDAPGVPEVLAIFGARTPPDTATKRPF